MHYPREGRIYTDSVDIHLPNEHPPLVSKLGLGKRMLRLIYNLFGTNPKHAIICNSGFTYEAFRSFYDVGNNVPIIYPGVETSSYEIDKAELTKNPKQVIALGRIALNKRQLEQIKLASKMPDYEFRIVGFIANQAYYDKCVEYIKSHQITNVHLHPNLAFPKMVALLQQSKYFLHTMIKEPFGITAIQAVAAGCIPIVHDSGGQRETINLPELRYKEIDEIPDMIKQLEVLSDTEIKSKIEYLQTHVKNNFSEDIFQKRMTEYLHKIIEEITATKS